MGSEDYKGLEKQEAAISVIKGMLGAVPFFGTFLNETFFELRGRIKQDRVNVFVNELGELVKNHSKEKIDFDFLKSGDFIDFMDSAILKSSKTKYNEKIKLFAKIIAGNLIVGEVNDYDNELKFLTIIEDLSIDELIVIKHLTPSKPKTKGLFYDVKENPEDKKNRIEYEKTHVFEFHSTHIDYHKDPLFELKPNMTRLAIEGLIAKSLALDQSTANEAESPRSYIALTPLGYELLNFLAFKESVIKS